MIRKKWIVIGLALGLSVPVSFVAHPASAATSDAIAQALVSATLQNLGLNDVSAELLQQLTGQLTDAIKAGVIDPAISAQVSSLLENPALISGLADVFNSHLDGETSAWRASVPTPDGLVGKVDGNSGGLDSGSGDNINPGDGGSGDSTDGQSDSGSFGDNSGDDNGSGNSVGNQGDNGDNSDSGDYNDDSFEDDSYGLPSPLATFPSRLRRTFTR